jgi:hypothetical protein
MSLHQGAKNSTIRLPSVLAVGFTGHRSLTDEPKSRKLICDFLQGTKAMTSGIAYGVSSAAAGGDLLFAECCIQLQIPLRVLLPLPRGSFREDFDEDVWFRVEKILDKAISVDVIGERERREEGYYECGIETVQQSQLLVALWDGKPLRGLGGTQQILAFAKNLGRPVIWFHSETGAKEIFNESALKRLQKQKNSELDFLNSLPDAGVTLSSDSSTDLARAWFQKVDRNATRFAPQVRRLSSIPIVCTAAAAFLSGAGLEMPHPRTWLAIGTALGITAAALPVLLRLGPRQSLWARTRTAAEVCRSALALWGTPLVDEVIGPEIIPELTGMLMSLKLLSTMDTVCPGISVDAFKARYRKERIADQKEFFSRHAVRSANEARKYRFIIWLCIGLAVLIAAWLYVSGMAFRHAHTLIQKAWLSVAVSALFQVATIAGALVFVHDCERRRRRYLELQSWLAEWDRELDALETWPTVLKVACRIERALLVELLEWKSLVRNVKMARK